MKALPRSFFTRCATIVAPELLGKGLMVRKAGDEMLVRIVEVEAYLADDPASHSFGGITRRNQSMFERGGTCYVYLSYGVHHCINVVTGKKGTGEAVLIRAAEPVSGIQAMLRRRRTEPPNLMNGPGKLTAALGIDLSDDGESLMGPGIAVVDLGDSTPRSRITTSPRIGITKATDLKLRFCDSKSRSLTR